MWSDVRYSPRDRAYRFFPTPTGFPKPPYGPKPTFEKLTLFRETLSTSIATRFEKYRSATFFILYRTLCERNSLDELVSLLAFRHSTRIHTLWESFIHRYESRLQFPPVVLVTLRAYVRVRSLVVSRIVSPCEPLAGDCTSRSVRSLLEIVRRGAAYIWQFGTMLYTVERVPGWYRITLASRFERLSVSFVCFVGR